MNISQQNFDRLKPNQKFIRKFQNQFLEDEEKGKEMNQKEKYILQPKEENSIQLLKKFLNRRKQEIQQYSENLKQEINNILNKKGKGNENMKIRELKVIGNQIEEYEIEDILNLFAHFEKEPFQFLNPNLKEEDIKKLFGIMIIFLQTEILNQKIIRTLNLCENFKKYSQNWKRKKNEEIKQIEKMH
ncbi:hypothetical protein M0811_04639 [Anaeramoeba ignava]|uniref:Uncharacterized protein n=1 Tax=Anaeramoeba ignava TaxID=1746090 RepID=A0A9Q0LUI6_ANAIG|nr:hypothetical protein M0811_04639 [Anaeramoeba ignava]